MVAKRKSLLERFGAFLHDRLVATITIIGAAASMIGGIYIIDGFYVRSSQYQADRASAEKSAHDIVNQLAVGALSAEVSNLETRHAFTRYRMNDARAKAKGVEDTAVQEYRQDMFSLSREIDGKKRLIDQLRAGK